VEREDDVEEDQEDVDRDADERYQPASPEGQPVDRGHQEEEQDAGAEAQHRDVLDEKGPGRGHGAADCRQQRGGTAAETQGDQRRNVVGCQQEHQTTDGDEGDGDDQEAGAKPARKARIADNRCGDDLPGG
jgi:hypothetical protein